jgi:hypothetical protein
VKSLAHVNHTPNAITRLHIAESLVDLIQRLAMRDELVNLELAIHVVSHKPRKLSASLDTTERATLPYTASDELEWTSGDLLTGGRNTDDDGLAPALVAGLERGAHNVDVTRAVESVVAAAVGHLDELLLDALVAELGGVDEVCSTELLGPLLLCVVDIDDDDLASLVLSRALDDGQTDAAGAEDGDVGALLDSAVAGSDDGRAVTGCDAAAEQAGAVHGGLLGDGDDGDVGYDGVLRECGGAHEVEEILALALEARCAVGHDTLSLCGADLAAEVGLAGLAELALLAFWGAVACQRMFGGNSGGRTIAQRRGRRASRL